ncbi:unnamed protein product [Rotaria sp. Silwood1]|nr:unnamed protein product [Rotaria sp. Silwood1]
MSTQQQRNTDSLLNNLPERNASKSATNGAAGGSTNAIGSEKRKEDSIPIGNNDTSAQHNAPIDKHGDTWGGEMKIKLLFIKQNFQQILN